MKISFLLSKQKYAGLSLVEAFVVVVALFALLALVVPGSGLHARARVVKAKEEMADIVNAVNAYHADYGHYPVPTNVEVAALAAKEDITYGGPLLDAALKSGRTTRLNADVVAILMDKPTFAEGKTPRVNAGYCLNPKQIQYLNANWIGDNTSPGVGSDGVYRDPWGHPYIISMDLNGDGECRDAFYRKYFMSGDKGTNGFHGNVMVWSMGPDGKAGASEPTTVSPNKDNILSWE